MFDVGSGIQEKMDELGDIAVRNSEFFHSIEKNPDGTPRHTTEFGYGFKFDYRSSNVRGNWETVAYYLNTQAPIPPILTTVEAIDVSSHQPTDLTNLINQFNPHHVVVKLYQSVEQPSPAHSRAQLNSALDNGCTIGGYYWLYTGIDIEQQVNDALQILAHPPVLWIDVEKYTDGSLPTLDEVIRSIEYIESLNIRPGIYTAKWVWDILDNPQELSSDLLWYADWSNPPSLDLAVPFGGWRQAAGHQYTSTPVDRSIFDKQYTEI
jgi:hypothetical protein